MAANGYSSIIEEARKKLDSRNEESRFQGMTMISHVNLVEAVPLLLQAMGDNSNRIREEALRGICVFPAEIILPQLEVFLRNNDEANLRTAALEAFPRYGREAATYLLELIRDPDEEVRMFVTALLGEILDPRAVEPLIAALKDPDENVRHAAVESLGRLKDPRAVFPLLECFSEDFWVKYPAVVALGEIGDPAAVAPLAGLLSDDMLRQAAIDSLGKIGDPVAIPILAGLLTQDDPSVRDETIAALARIQSRNER